MAKATAVNFLEDMRGFKVIRTTKLNFNQGKANVNYSQVFEGIDLRS